MKVIVAGVLMNFLLAWILLSIGFTAGMEPLLGPEDILPAVDNGVIELQEGVKINTVVEDTFADQLGFVDLSGADLFYQAARAGPDHLFYEFQAVGLGDQVCFLINQVNHNYYEYRRI